MRKYEMNLQIPRTTMVQMGENKNMSLDDFINYQTEIHEGKIVEVLGSRYYFEFPSDELASKFMYYIVEKLSPRLFYDSGEYVYRYKIIDDHIKTLYPQMTDDTPKRRRRRRHKDKKEHS